MPWSTREVAELAGTTVNTVRHYHRIGLLEDPSRRPNGYKQYEVRHLVRILQIRRLRDLGVPLEQIEQVGASGVESSEALLAIDADLAATIERLQRARAAIRAILQGSSATGVPAGFEHVASRLSKPEQSLVLIYSQLYDEDAMADLRRMVEEEPEDASRVFEALTPDADEATRAALAQEYAPIIARSLATYPWLTDQSGRVTKTELVTRNTVVESVAALYNSAQLDVLVRAALIAQTLLPPADPDAT
ncbi:MerR family transcriptional regulator [Microbacteriaceae bacterium VKM Ac-2855]|nr:MerR family transcriptional regulator [Microbacteriaceae bacterium VKM Ac-2855]